MSDDVELALDGMAEIEGEETCHAGQSTSHNFDGPGAALITAAAGLSRRITFCRGEGKSIRV